MKRKTKVILVNTLFCLSITCNVFGQDSGKGLSEYYKKCAKLKEDISALDQFLSEIQSIQSGAETSEDIKAIAESAEACLRVHKGETGLICPSSQTGKAVEKLQALEAFCAHYEKAIQSEKKYNQIRPLVAQGQEWMSGDASDMVRQGSGWDKKLLQLTSIFLINTGINKEILKRCGDFDPASTEGKKILDDIDKGKYAEGKIWEPMSCISNGPFVEPGKGSQMSFFSDFTRNPTLNIGKICSQHAKNYCLPAFAYYKMCETSLGGGAQKACFDDAKAAIKSCVQGGYEAKVPEGVLGGVSNPGALYSQSGEGLFAKTPGAQFVAVKSVGKLAAASQVDAELFTAQFHEMYSTCVIMRAASEKMANGEKKIIVDEKIPSVNHQYYCIREEPWTVDFNQCATAIQWADGLGDVVAAGANMGVNLKNSLNQSSINKDLNKDLAEGDQTAYIKAQEAQLRRAAEGSMAKSAISGTHGMSLVYAAGKIPSPNELSTACSTPLESHYKDPAINCGVAWIVDNNPGLAATIFNNQKLKERFYYKAADKMATAAFEGIMAVQQKKQASDLGQIQKQYNEFYNQDSVTPEYQSVDYCTANPSAPSCIASNRVMQDNGEAGFGNIGIGNQGGGSFSFSKGVEDGFESEENLSPEELAAREDLGDIFSNGGGEKFNNDFTAPGAAKAKYGKAAGGGGGSASAGGGGGSTAPAPNKGGGGPTAQSMATKGAPRMVSGSGSSYKPGRSRSSKKRNTFQNLLDQNKSRGVATTVEDIAPAKSKLFDKISKRYSKVSQDKRLYEFSAD